jgi:signal recognition particle subunit SEC65
MEFDADALAAAASSSVSSSFPSTPQPPKIDPSELKHYICLYCAYFDTSISVRKGRRLPLEKLKGCEDVWAEDIAEAAFNLGFHVVVEGNKRHPSEFFKAFGPPGFARIRVELKKKSTNELVNPSIPSKEVLISRIAEIIPGLPRRNHRLAQIKKLKEDIQQKQAAALKNETPKVEKKKLKNK